MTTCCNRHILNAWKDHMDRRSTVYGRTDEQTEKLYKGNWLIKIDRRGFLHEKLCRQWNKKKKKTEMKRKAHSPTVYSLCTVHIHILGDNNKPNPLHYGSSIERKARIIKANNEQKNTIFFSLRVLLLCLFLALWC